MPRAVTIERIDGKPGQVYYPLKLIDVPKPSPGPGELLVRIIAAGLNHRDVWIRKHLYPGTTFNVPLLADGVGIVVSTGSAELESKWKGKRVLLTPARGWEKSPEGPDSPTNQYATLGGTKFCPLGTLQEYLSVAEDEVEEAPHHLNDAEAAALPLVGLTAWRALFTKSANAKPGHNLLITGIGGGVALMAFQLANAAGCNVFVTSSSEEKLQKAREMGAQGAVNYKEEAWEKRLMEQLPKRRSYLDAVIDGAGGDVVERTLRLLKHGGVIVSYGMTLGPQLPFSMAAVMKNIEVRGSTMGSRQEFSSMVRFVQAKHIRPIISRTVQGIEDLPQLDMLFDDMKTGSQFGKLVIRIMKDDGVEDDKSRL